MAEFICIGIPARNEQESIERTIRSITKSIVWQQTPSSDKELIVCVNGSTDRTTQTVRNIAKQVPEIKLIELKQAGKNQAINTIVAHSSKRADAIYFSDADVLVKRDTIGKVLKELRANPKIEFAAPVVVPSAAFFPAKKRSPTAALYAEGSRIGRQLKTYRLSGMGFAAKKQFLSNTPLPEHPIIDGAYFINLAYPEKIKMVYDAIIVFRQPNWRDHFRQRTRHILDRRVLLEKHPELKEREVIERKKLDFRNINFIERLSPRAKVGALLNRIALNAATIKSKRKQKELWPQIKSTKLHKRR